MKSLDFRFLQAQRSLSIFRLARVFPLSCSNICWLFWEQSFNCKLIQQSIICKLFCLCSAPAAAPLLLHFILVSCRLCLRYWAGTLLRLSVDAFFYLCSYFFFVCQTFWRSARRFGVCLPTICTTYDSNIYNFRCCCCWENNLRLRAGRKAYIYIYRYIKAYSLPYPQSNITLLRESRVERKAKKKL